MPLHPNVPNLHHLVGLHPPTDLVAWLAGFDTTGIWIPTNAKAAHDLSQQSKTPKSGQKSTPKSTRKKSSASLLSPQLTVSEQSTSKQSVQRKSLFEQNLSEHRAIDISADTSNFVPSVVQLCNTRQDFISRNISVQSFLHTNNLTVKYASSDGHCMIHAWLITTGMLMTNIHQCIIDEYLLNRNIYESFGVSEDDLQHYLAFKDYRLHSVDTLLNILCNSTLTTAIVVEERRSPKQVVTDFKIIRPRSGHSQSTIFLLRKNEHYDAIV